MGGETTEMSETTTHVAHRGGALGRGLDVPHRQAAQAHLRGRQAQRARRRPDDLPRPRPTGWSSCSPSYGGGTVEPGVTVVGDAARAAADHDRRSTCPRGSPAWTSTRRPRSPHLRGGRLRGRRRRPTASTVTAAALAPRPHRPLRPGRGGRPDRRLRPGPVGAARRRRPGRGLTRAQRLRRRVGRTLAGAGLRRGGQLPVRRRRRPRRARAAGRRRAAHGRCGWPTRSPRRSRR